jgi:hypothetical protein
VAPRDGTSIALIARDAPLGPLIGAPGAQFDATKLSWLGTPAIETNVCIAYHTAPVKTFGELLEKQLVVGDTGPGTGVCFLAWCDPPEPRDRTCVRSQSFVKSMSHAL